MMIRNSLKLSPSRELEINSTTFIVDYLLLRKYFSKF